MRWLWLLPRAAPALLRHLMGYAELAVQDLEDMQQQFSARLIAGALFGFGLFFVVLLGILAVVAMTWDTPHRVSAIAWMGGGFLLLTVIAGAYRSQVLGAQSPFLSTVRREWREDRIIVDHILSPDRE